MYINPKSVAYNEWTTASLETAKNLRKKPFHSRILRERAQAFILDREDLPFNLFGTWNESAIDKDESLAQEIHVHLQRIGKFVKAIDLVNFLDTDEMRARTGYKKRMDV